MALFHSVYTTTNTLLIKPESSEGTSLHVSCEGIFSGRIIKHIRGILRDMGEINLYSVIITMDWVEIYCIQWNVRDYPALLDNYDSI
jgi:hypothetical protein